MHSAALLLLLWVWVCAGAGDSCIWRHCYRVVSYGSSRVSLSRLDFYKCSSTHTYAHTQSEFNSDFEAGADSELCEAPQEARTAVEAQLVMLDLETIPRGFCALRELELLSLHHNRIAGLSLNEACTDDSRLRILDLRFNKLQTLDMRVLFTLTALREAWLDYNEIQQILPIDSADASLYRLNTLPLRLLSLRGNRLRTIDVSLLQVVSLQHVDLSYNRVARVTNLRWKTAPATSSPAQGNNGEEVDLDLAGELQTIKNLRMMRGVSDEHFHRVLNVSLFGNDFSSLFEELRTLEASRHLYQGFSINFAEPSMNLFYMLIKYLKDFDFLAINVTEGTIRCDCTLFPTLSGLRALVKPQSQFVAEVATIRRLIGAIHCAPDYDGNYDGDYNGDVTPFESPMSLMLVDDSKLTCLRQTNDSSPLLPGDCPHKCRCYETPGRSALTIDCHNQKLIGTPKGMNFYIDAVLRRWKFSVWNVTSLPSYGTRVNLTIDLSNNHFTDVDFDLLLPADVDNAVVTLDVTANRLIDPKSALDSLARLALRFNGTALRVRLSGNHFGCLCNDSHSIESLTRRLTLNRLALDVLLPSVLRQCSTICNMSTSTSSSTSTSAPTTPPPNDLFVAVPNATAMLVVAALCTVCVLVLLFALLSFHFYTRMRRRRHTSTKVLVAAPSGCECTASPHSLARPRGVCVYQNIVNNVDLFSDVPHFATLRPAHVKSAPQFDSCNTSPLTRASKRCVFATQPQPCELSRSQTLLGCGETDENELNGRVGACRFAVSDWSDEPTRIRTDGFDVDITAV